MALAGLVGAYGSSDEEEEDEKPAVEKSAEAAEGKAGKDEDDDSDEDDSDEEEDEDEKAKKKGPPLAKPGGVSAHDGPCVGAYVAPPDIQSTPGCCLMTSVSIDFLWPSIGILHPRAQPSDALTGNLGLIRCCREVSCPRRWTSSTPSTPRPSWRDPGRSARRYYGLHIG
jgi:hypothetical protein